MKPPECQILIVDDEPGQRTLLARFVSARGYAARTASSGEEALDQISADTPAMVLLDVRLPGIDGLETLRRIRTSHPELPVLLVTAYADLRQAVEAVKSGADDYLSKPIDLDELAVAIVDAVGNAAGSAGVEARSFPELPAHVTAESTSLQRVLETAALVAQSDAPVLITGESGVGKEVVAELIHRWSDRSAGPLITANCAGLPETLIESELFGHAKGAFTGATENRAGYFRAADGGTLLLDEIGEFPLHLQPKLLRALETHQIVPVGNDLPIGVNVRVVAATNRDLEAEVREGRFREDLYYRLNVIELHVPPLRERREEIVPLVRRMGDAFVETGVRLSPQALQCLLAYDWPGNVRELRNAVQRACLLCHGDVVMPEHLPPKVRALAATPKASEAGRSGRLSEMERATILATLEQCHGNRTQAAKVLGISRRGLLYKLRALQREATEGGDDNEHEAS
jgi:DNA-binding NtrC family response regulator